MGFSDFLFFYFLKICILVKWLRVYVVIVSSALSNQTFILF